MNRLLLFLSIIFSTINLAGCASSPYYGENYSYNNGYYSRDHERCANCGEVRDIERIRVRQESGGGGALLGAIIGGALGNTVGKGDGRTAATIAGAVAGGFAGNAVENKNKGHGNMWRFHIRMDNGRWAVITQYDNPGLHRGDRVSVQGDHVVPAY